MSNVTIHGFMVNVTDPVTCATLKDFTKLAQWFCKPQLEPESCFRRFCTSTSRTQRLSSINLHDDSPQTSEGFQISSRISLTARAVFCRQDLCWQFFYICTVIQNSLSPHSILVLGKNVTWIALHKCPKSARQDNPMHQ